LDGVSIHPVTTKLLERKVTTPRFHHGDWTYGDFKTVTEFNGCGRRPEDGSTTL
jgi:hypothetical protein